MSRRPSVQHQALQFLITLLNSTGGTASVRLPTIQKLAVQAGVSHVTMLKAVRVLQRQGALQVQHGKGIHTTGGKASPLQKEEQQMKPQSIPKWEQVARAIRQDILKGEFRSGVLLPRPKELGYRYGVCRHTIMKTLAHCADREILERNSLRYSVPKNDIHSRQSLLLIAAGDRNGTISMATARTRENLKLLEEECSRCRIRIVPATFDDASGEMHVPAAAVPLLCKDTGKDQLLGIALWQAGIDRHPWADLVYRYLDLRVPIAVLDESGELPHPSNLRIRSKVAVFAYGFNTDSGERMGNYLLSCGHKKIAYVSVLHRALWSRNRLEGLRRAYTAVGYEHGIVACTVDDFSFGFEYIESAESIRGEINGLLCRDNNRSGLLGQTLAGLQAHVPAQLERAAFAGALSPLLESLVDDKEITAWVAADDDMAIPCLDFLAVHGIAVPGRISVAGFDNSFDGFLRRLTTYNYNPSAYIHAMIRYILDPSAVPAKSGSVAFGGEVIVRATTR